ncbi:MAG: hypothetical protein ACK2U9_17350, partial [Anaerolineae bacterium]
MRIVLDAMGGDWAPEVTVEGAVLGARKYDVTVVLVGRPDAIGRELDKHDIAGLDLPIVPASQVVEMTDKPAEIVRSKPDSSMHIGMELVRQGYSLDNETLTALLQRVEQTLPLIQSKGIEPRDWISLLVK